MDGWMEMKFRNMQQRKVKNLTKIKERKIDSEKDKDRAIERRERKDETHQKHLNHIIKAKRTSERNTHSQR